MSGLGSRFEYKKTAIKEGNRVAYFCTRDEADWQSNCILNKFIDEDGQYQALKLLRYIRIDVDAEKCSPKMLTKEGVINVNKVKWILSKKHKVLLNQIEYITKSTSGKGVHILIGLSSLPLNEDTSHAQNFVRKIQLDIIDILNEFGIGADKSSTGLVQDFCTYRKESNVLLHNEVLTKRIDNSAKSRSKLDTQGVSILQTKASRPKFLNILNDANNRVMIELGIKGSFRLYHDDRVEKPFARLVLFLMGMLKDCVIQKDSMFYATQNAIELSIHEIELIMESCKRNFANYRKTDEFKKLFHIEKVSGRFEEGRYTISLVDSKDLDKVIKRAINVLSIKKSIRFNLVQPEFVADGARNQSVVSWALALKFEGIAQEVAVAKIQELVKKIPGYETSDSCRRAQVKCTVRSIYNHQKENYGCKLGTDSLPDWLKVEDVIFNEEEPPKPLITSATITLGRRILLAAGEQDYTNILAMGNQISTSFEKEKTPDLISQSSPDVFSVTVVSFKQRIGFYLNKHLVLILKKSRHYKLSNAIIHIEKFILDDKVKIQKIHHKRHNCKDFRFYAEQLYADNMYALRADQVCGRKADKAISIAEFKKHKFEREMSRSLSLEEFESIHSGAPEFDYHPSIFSEFSESDLH